MAAPGWGSKMHTFYGPTFRTEKLTFLGIDISKTRKHVMPKNVLSKNHVSIVEVKFVVHFWWLARSIGERNVFRFDTRIRMIMRVAPTCAKWQQQNIIVLPCFVL